MFLATWLVALLQELLAIKIYAYCKPVANTISTEASAFVAGCNAYVGVGALPTIIFRI